MNEHPQNNFPKSEWMDVETRVAEKDQCCGCGVCAAICPVEGCITIKFDANKQYRPFVDPNICINCGLCLHVCPDDSKVIAKVQEMFEKNHPNLEENELIGPTLRSYVGHASNDHDRLASASGGVLTAVLEELIVSGKIDAVVLVGESDYRLTGKFFESKLITNVEEIRANRGSKYYPIEYSKVLNIMKSDNRCFAVVAIPCVTIALRKAQLYNLCLQRNIRYILTPVCGHNVSGFYTEYLLQTNGINPSSVIRLTYRDKKNTPVANDFNLAVEFVNAHGEVEVKRLGFQLSNVGKTWHNYMFTMNKCLYCTDFAGELSDASFADAWLPEYAKDVRGTSMVMVRNSELNRMIQNMVESGKLQLSFISQEMIIAAHKNRFRQKKELIKSRIRWQNLFNRDFPNYGVDWRNTKLWEGFSENLKSWLHLHLSRSFYRYGLLTKLGTERFLNLVDTPIRLAVGAAAYVKLIIKSITFIS